MKKVKLTWLGHSCFIVEKDGYQVLFDPYSDGSVPGYGLIRPTADLVLCSHEHRDHCARELVTLKNGVANPFTITKIDTFHDDTRGSQRGANVIHILDAESMRLVHFGDLGCMLTKEQKEELGSPDVILLPVGGTYTIDAVQAAALVREIQPGTVVPMHYRSGAVGYPVLGTVEEFLTELSDWELERCEGNIKEFGERGNRQICVLKLPEDI